MFFIPLCKYTQKKREKKIFLRVSLYLFINRELDLK